MATKKKQQFVDRRKVYVEVVSQTGVLLVTPYYSKEFKFTRADDCLEINLINLKPFTSKDHKNFYAVVNYTDTDDKGNRCPAECCITIFVRTGEFDDDFENIGEATIKDNKKTFQVSFKPKD